MKKNIRLVLGLLTIAIFTWSCTPKQSRIVIISTNDIHSSIDQFPRLATLVEQYRHDYPDHTLLVDAGDRWTGNPFVDLAANKCQPIIELFDSLGYDVATMGNHEFDFGLDLLSQRMSQASFRKVLANAWANGSAMPQFEPYTFITVGGKKIGIVGLITVTESGYPEGAPATFGTTTFETAYQAAQRYRHLKDSCDLLVAITHIGYPEDSILAVRAPEFDLIIGGHSHTVLPEGIEVGNTLVTQSGRALKYAGITTITFQGKEIEDIDYQLVELDTIAPSAKFQKMVDTYNFDPSLNAKAGEMADTFDFVALSNMISDVMRNSTGADIAFQHYGGVRIRTLPQGNVRVADLFRLEPFSSKPVIVEITEDQLEEMIKHKFNSSGKEGHRIDLLPSGLSYTVKLDNQGNAEDVDIKFATRKKIYKVALPDYVNLTYTIQKSGKDKQDNRLITTLISEYLIAKSPIKADSTPRAVIMTEEND